MLGIKERAEKNRASVLGVLQQRFESEGEFFRATIDDAIYRLEETALGKRSLKIYPLGDLFTK